MNLEKFQSFINKCIRHSNLINIWIFLTIHLLFMFFYLYVGVPILGLLSIVSALYYIFILLFYKEMSYMAKPMSFFVTIGFAVISTIVLGIDSMFFVYILCAIFSAFFLMNDKGIYAYWYQLFAGLVVILLFFGQKFYETILISYKTILEPYMYGIKCFNILFCCLLYFFYGLLFAMESELFFRKKNEKQEELDFSQSYDQLTGLLNRRSMRLMIQEMKYGQKGRINVAALDIDNFKIINDRYGYDSGNKTIQVVARCLMESFEDMKVCRWSGEEFLILDTKLSEKEFHHRIVVFHEEIQKKQIVLQKNNLCITMTVGIWSGGDMYKIDNYIWEAGNLLYYGKRKRKNSIFTNKTNI